MSRYTKFLLSILGVFAIIVLVLMVVNKRSKPNPLPSGFIDRTEAIIKERKAAESKTDTKSDLPYNTTTYRNNYGTNIFNAQSGTFSKSSFSWTISKNNDIFNIKTNAMSGSFNVVYSHYDSNKLYHYKASGSAIFDNAVVKVVMTNGKLDQYAAGDLSNGNILTIIFTDNNGYIYKLGK